jgi:hypothetical protein
MKNTIIEILKIIIFTSVLFVWCVRYQNIIEEFKKYGYPTWLRDLVGILKISFVIMIISKEIILTQIGATGIIILMIAALSTHLRIKNKIALMLPSFVLMSSSIIILVSTL